MTSIYPLGTAPVKPEFLLQVNSGQSTDVPVGDAAEGTSSHVRDRAGAGEDERSSVGPSRKKRSKAEKKAQRGANKGRRFGKIRDEVEVCWKVAAGQICEFGDECRFTHDIPAYLAAKPRDIRIPDTTQSLEIPPFIPPQDFVADAEFPSLDMGTICPVFAEMGECRFALKCRFLGGHVRKSNGALEMISDTEKRAHAAISATELNFMSPEALKNLRTKKYNFPISSAYLKEIQTAEEKGKGTMSHAAAAATTENVGDDLPSTAIETIAERTGGTATVTQVDTPDVPMRFNEKKRLHWSGKTYLAPLTTVGNLPFRRLCVAYGADITCGEMGLANSFLAGSKEEWSLIRRHPSESIFGVQLAGNKAAALVPTAETVAKECAGNVDFVDINCGCPIDLVFQTGSGSALLDTPGKLGKIIVGMNKALGEIPVTVKLRTGVKDGRNTAHKLMPRLSTEWNVGCISLHGRTRQQRYTKLADWEYIKQCVAAVRGKEEEENCPAVPIFGGGDCFSSEGYWSVVENSGVDGVMIGRGALIKPWIFTEIKEHREWDISARERLDLIKKVRMHGAYHFGSDTAGINTTRRYLCEALSFQYRYIPIGLLEALPGRINDRAPPFRGRNELETLLASPDSRDWVKLSEMFLGPAPASWSFTPKHKSNAYGAEESQG
ncbi:zinc finger dihydrouridine synthase [Pleurotus eryngii]|uniref:tRNA-dihydrouridine(47) synthase [NAD(P)(+)] n=1 Tax=Pleurotus eryngii TaxID=5323 RepID=A0A9P6DI92_PLEER|nr:zinc finger dihydrouridine synthase [Pleurotus eryngii]